MLDTLAMGNMLSGEYKEAFQKIDLYGSMNNVNVDVYEDRMLNLYDMFTAAQSEEKPVDKIIGKDIESFCQDYFKVYEKSYPIKKVIGRIAYLSMIMFVFSAIEILWQIDEGIKLNDMKVDIIPFLVGCGVGVILLVLCKLATKNLIFKNDKIKPMFYYIFILLFIIIGIVIANKFLGDYAVDLPLLPVLIVSGVFSFVYYGVTAIVRYKKTGTISKMTKADKAERKEFDKEIEFQSGVKESAQIMAKRFEKLRKKNEKKGKPEYTYKEFTKVIVDEAKYTGVYNLIMILIFVTATVVPAVKSCLAGEYVEGGLYAGIFGTLMFFVARLMVKSLNEVKRENLHVLKECEEQGIDVIEYNKRINESDEN